MSAPIPRISDIRGLVARQTGQSFGRRLLSQIHGVVFHQELGDGDVYSVARYHVSKDCHISPGKGCPSICYTYFIDSDGSIYWVNDLESVTWSQGGGAAPIIGTKANTNYLAVVFRGDFSGPEHEGKSRPTAAQLAAGAELWRWLRDTFSLAAVALYGHCDFGKPACPGTELMDLIAKLRGEPGALSAVTPESVEDWQRALVNLKYDIGASGPRGGGVDGDWGKLSEQALLSFQTSAGIPRSKARDGATANAIAHALLAAGFTSLAPPSSRRRKSKEA